jgi:hypothetical protein
MLADDFGRMTDKAEIIAPMQLNAAGQKSRSGKSLGRVVGVPYKWSACQ